MICPKCKFDNPAGMTFCGKCGTSLSRLCPSCGFENPLDFTFCGKCGYDLRRPAEAVSALRRGEPQAYTPRHLADKILTTKSAMEGERKQVTVLFADVSGFTSISEKLDPEEVHALVNRCLGILLDQIHRYEGTITQFTGDGVMALFGAPIAHEDAPQRGLHAALAIQQALKRYAEELKREQGIEFQMRMGLNTGPVVVGKIGDDLTMEYTAVGDTVNLAARMEQMAEPGAILVAEATQRLTEGYFEFKPLGPVEVKGKAEPVLAYEVTGLGPIRTRIEAAELRGLTKFVGRIPEMEHLMVCHRRVKEGQGQVIGIVGEAGVGKSRLLLEFLRSKERHDLTYLEGHCIHYGETLPYYPFIEMVKRYCAIEDIDREFIYRKKLRDTVLGLDPAFEGTLPFLEDLLSLKVEDEAYARMEPDQRRWKTMDAVKTLFIRESQEKPLILAIEDMHWIDKSSEELLTHLIEGIANAKILLLCLYRPEYRHRWGELSYYSRLGVDQLSPTSSAELVEALLEEGRVADDLRDLVLGKAGGNPLFVEEFTRSLLDIGAIARADDKYVLTRKASEIEVPDTLQAVIAARIDRLEETLKRVLQVASVIGREFAFRVLRVILEMEEELRRHLANLQGLEFIYEKGLFPELEYMFKHALTQEVAYNSLLLQRRKEFHRRIAEAMEELYAETLPKYLGPLAYHYYRAEAWEKAFEYMMAAGERARAAYATREAVDYFDKAIEVSQRIPDVVSKEQLMRLYGSRARTWRAMTEYEKAVPDYEMVAEIARELGDKGREARALMDLAWCYGGGGGPMEMEKAKECLDKSLEIIKETGDVAGEVRWLIQAGGWRGLMGQLAEAEADLQRALDMCRQFGDRRGIGLAVGYLGLLHHFMGDFEACIREVQESADIARDWGNQFLLLSTFHWVLMGFAGHGEYDEAFKALGELSRLAHEIGSKHFIVLVPNHYGWLYNELCNFEKAIVHDEEGVEVSQRYDDPECEIFSLLNLVGDYIRLGDYDRAQYYLDEVQKKRELKWYRERRWRYDMHLTRYLSEVWLARGDYPKAMEFAEDTLARGQNTGSKKYIAMGWKLKGEVLMAMGRLDEAADCLEKARELADQIGNPPLMWKTRYSLSQVYSKQGKPEAAKAELEQAIAVIERMASKVSDAEVRETFLRSQPVQAVREELKAL